MDTSQRKQEWLTKMQLLQSLTGLLFSLSPLDQSYNRALRAACQASPTRAS